MVSDATADRTNVIHVDLRHAECLQLGDGVTHPLRVTDRDDANTQGDSPCLNLEDTRPRASLASLTAGDLVVLGRVRRVIARREPHARAVKEGPMGGAHPVHVGIDFNLHPAVERSIQQEWKVTMHGRLTADELSPLDAEVCHLVDHTKPVGGRHGSVIAPRTARGVAVLTLLVAPRSLEAERTAVLDRGHGQADQEQCGAVAVPVARDEPARPAPGDPALDEGGPRAGVQRSDDVEHGLHPVPHQQRADRVLLVVDLSLLPTLRAAVAAWNCVDLSGTSPTWGGVRGPTRARNPVCRARRGDDRRP